MTPLIQILDGPNLGRLGKREPALYGTTTWDELAAACRAWAQAAGCRCECRQTDAEGELVGLIHAASDGADGLVLNAAAYTHTSVAVRDAVAAAGIPVVEVHLTNPAAREDFRRTNLLEDVVTARVAGFGTDSYRLAITGLAARLGAGSDES
ncbi:MAG: type II 3-dehydroquinate dehydratase [bacterium]|nr:type II 3-dehydroquinate dehydratase [bacterium]